MTAARKLLMAPAAAGAFNPETGITWHSLFWAAGTDFVAEGYSDTDAVGTWPNETAESDATQASAGLKPIYADTTAVFNDQPSVFFDGSGEYLDTSAFSTAPTYPISVVVVARLNDTSVGHTMVDGTTTTTESRISSGGAAPTYWTIDAGTVRVGATAANTSAHLFVAHFTGSTDSTLTVDGTEVINADAGAEEITALRIGAYFGGTASPMSGPVAFVGIYEGDITADGSWSDFTAWVETHYGLTIA